MWEHIVKGVSSYDTECGNISSKVLVVMIQSVNCGEVDIFTHVVIQGPPIAV